MQIEIRKESNTIKYIGLLLTGFILVYEVDSFNLDYPKACCVSTNEDTGICKSEKELKQQH